MAPKGPVVQDGQLTGIKRKPSKMYVPKGTTGAVVIRDVQPALQSNYVVESELDGAQLLLEGRGKEIQSEDSNKKRKTSGASSRSADLAGAVDQSLPTQ
jgi:hypothetical protein